MKKLRLVTIIALICAIVLPAMAETNDFLQPPGAPGSRESMLWSLNQRETRKAISELPFLIDKPGSYYLTAPLRGTNEESGITIDADDVKLDLNGFSLNGVSGSVNGVEVTSPFGQRNNISIRNGVIRGWDSYGIQGTNAHDSSVDNVMVYGNGLAGIEIGHNALIKDCTAFGNGYKNNPFRGWDDGIHCGEFGSILNCKSRGNKGAGIYAGMSTKVDGCTAAGNHADGIFSESYGTIKECTVVGNSCGGVTVLEFCRVEDNNCGYNSNTNGFDGAGIRVEGSCNRIENNNVMGNRYGIRMNENVAVFGNLVVRNSASGNTMNFYWNSTGSGNHYGAIIYGGQMGSDFTNSNPWANFEF
jgi:hypothetical protein